MAFPCYLQTPLKAYLQSFYSSWPSNALDLQNPVFQPNTENITWTIEMLEVSLLFLFCLEVYWETFGTGQWWQQQQEGHGLLMLFNIITVSVFFFFPPVSVLMFVGVCACPGWCLCVVRGGSSQTDNDRGGRTESERDECSVYWNKCKDRLQCQTGRACAPTCVCVLIVLSSDWLLSHTHVCEKVCFKHQFPLVTSEENWLFFKLSLPPVMICIGQPFITKSQRGVPEFANQQPAQHWSPQQ